VAVAGGGVGGEALHHRDERPSVPRNLVSRYAR
jgi:hypothetical protein